MDGWMDGWCSAYFSLAPITTHTYAHIHTHTHIYIHTSGTYRPNSQKHQDPLEKGYVSTNLQLARLM
jgi:hypothetical protein